MTSPILTARDLLVRRAGRVILDLPEVELRSGEVLAVLGANGAGKSTLLRCLALLERPERGVITFQGRPVAWREALTYRRRMAVIFQEPLLLDTSVFENVATGLRLRGAPASEITGRVDHWLDRVGMVALARRPVRTLSGGEARRVSLARALVLEPEILFLDEPTSALDVPTRAAFIRDLPDHLAAQGTTAVLITHDWAEARALADRVLVLIDGRPVQLGPVDEVFDCPADPRVATLLADGYRPARRPSRSV